MDFYQAFEEIDIDGNGTISVAELEDYMNRKQYERGFVEKWLGLFDMDGDGQITYKEYCDTLGLVLRPRPGQVEEDLVQSKSAISIKSGVKKTHSDEDQVAIKETKSRRAFKSAPSARKEGDVTRIKKGGGKKGEKKSTIIGLSRPQVFKRKALYRYTQGDKKLQKPLTDKLTSAADTNKSSSARSPKSYETSVAHKSIPKRPNKSYYSQHKRKLRSSLTPGRLLILLVGRHRGKRTVLLSCLPSGYLLVSGPFKLNGVPLRRVHPRSVIATGTSLDLSQVSIPDTLNDDFFKQHKTPKRLRSMAAEKEKKDKLFVNKEKKYELSSERKVQQKTVDSQLLATIKGMQPKEEAIMMRKYLTGRFHLSVNDLPHKMKF